MEIGAAGIASATPAKWPCISNRRARSEAHRTAELMKPCRPTPKVRHAHQVFRRRGRLRPTTHIILPCAGRSIPCCFHRPQGSHISANVENAAARRQEAVDAGEFRLQGADGVPPDLLQRHDTIDTGTAEPRLQAIARIVDAGMDDLGIAAVGPKSSLRSMTSTSRPRKCEGTGNREADRAQRR
jgi:hypothetical protein